MWVNSGKLQINCPTCLSLLFPQFSDLSTFSVVLYTPVLQETLGAKWSHQTKLSCTLDRSRVGNTLQIYFSDSKLFCSFCISFFSLQCQKQLAHMSSNYPIIIIQRTKIPRGTQKVKVQHFSFTSFWPIPMPDVLQLMPACLATCILNS